MQSIKIGPKKILKFVLIGPIKIGPNANIHTIPR